MTLANTVTSALTALEAGAAEDVARYAAAISADLARAAGRPELYAEVLAQAHLLAEKHRLTVARATLDVALTTLLSTLTPEAT